LRIELEQLDGLSMSQAELHAVVSEASKFLEGLEYTRREEYLREGASPCGSTSGEPTSTNRPARSGRPGMPSRWLALAPKRERGWFR
jgi:hypothetical protein